MLRELNLLAQYPRSPRNPAARAATKTLEDQAIAREFGRDFFDGKRRYGYGGYTYSPTRWKGVVDDFMATYQPQSVLDVGCAKGYMLQDFRDRGCKIAGIDISEYAINAAPLELRPFLRVGNAKKLPYPDKSFDLAISINTVHNLPYRECLEALSELERVGRQAYVTVDAYRTDEEKQRMEDWNLTALTILHADEWLEAFKAAGYTGDYGFWMP